MQRWCFPCVCLRESFFPSLSHQPCVEGHHKGIVQQNVELSHLSRAFFKKNLLIKSSLFWFLLARIHLSKISWCRTQIYFSHISSARNELPEIRKSPPRPIYFPRCCCVRDSPNAKNSFIWGFLLCFVLAMRYRLKVINIFFRFCLHQFPHFLCWTHGWSHWEKHKIGGRVLYLCLAAAQGKEK